MAKYKLCSIGVIDTVRNTTIPADMNNRDYVNYLNWVADGNTPAPMDALVVPATDPVQTAMSSDVAYAALVKAMAVHFNLTTDQITAMIKAQVGT